MKPQLYASTYERLRTEPTWRLLSANTAPEVLGLLQYLLYDSERTLPASVLTGRLTTELEILRAHGRELAGSARFGLGTRWSVDLRPLWPPPREPGTPARAIRRKQHVSTRALSDAARETCEDHKHGDHEAAMRLVQSAVRRIQAAIEGVST